MTRLQPARLAAALLAVAAALACSTTSMPVVPSGGDSAAPVPMTPAPEPVPAPEPAQARYRATFRSSWSAQSHPVDFPASAHFSPLVGAVHAPDVSFWNEGHPASLGMQDMAERGLTFRLVDEIGLAVAAGTATPAFTGPALGSTPGMVSVDFEVTQTHPLITLVTMVAPSPDWFVGVSGLRLFDGRWTGETTVALVPWDAGSDSGITFTSPDLPSTPHVPIARIVTAPLAPQGGVVPLGTFTFTRLP